MKKFFLVIFLLMLIGLLYFLYSKKYNSKDCQSLQKIVEVSFHTIPNGQEKDFSKKLEYLKSEKYSPIMTSDLYDYKIKNKPLPANPVLIIFEDGDYSWYKTAYPALKNLNLKSNFAITTNFVNGLLPWKKVKEMIGFRNNKGERIIELISHSVNHNDKLFHENGELLTDESKFNLKLNFLYELFYSKKIIEDNTNSQISYFSTPFGGLNEYTEKDLVLREVAKDVGYKAVLSANKFIIPDKYSLDAIRINADLPYENFKKEMQKIKNKICQ